MSGTHRRCLIVISGKSTRGIEDRFCGWTDPPLSREGRQMVLSLGQQIEQSGRLPRIWYVSDRRRSIETFEILTAGRHAPVVVLSDKLREINFGVYENLTWEELPFDFQQLYERCLKQPMDLKFPGGEGFSDLCDRVSAAALDILSYQEDDSDLAVVGHQGSMRLWYMMAAGLGPEAFFAETPHQAEGKWLDLSAADVAQWRHKYLNPRSKI
ncbi:MAG: histidine phosphatase family protein [Proteobacteria bacterium]|nr:histidine phosphatase family protein [Pseudomonadota bacterium]